MSRRRFLCMHCGVDTGKIGEHYMLRDDVWFQAHANKLGMLCAGCIEERLGRPLVPADFNDSYVNERNFAVRSMRLVSRMGL